MQENNDILNIGKEIEEKMRGEKPGLFNSNYWQGRMMEWVMEDSSFKTDMFRFVDVLPTLLSKEQISVHIREYLLKDNRKLPTLLGTALKLASSRIGQGVAASTIRKNVISMANRFIVGENVESARKKLAKLHKQGIAFTADLLGEATLSEKEGDLYFERYLQLIELIAKETANWPKNDIIDNNHLGPIFRANVSLKITSICPHLKALDKKTAVADLKERIIELFLCAKKNKVFINVDLEQWQMHDITYTLFEEVLSHHELETWPHVGIVVQSYLKNSRKDLERLLYLAKNRNSPITVRLVKGAYWDYETVIATQKGFSCPVYNNKEESDMNFEELTSFMFDNIEHLIPAFGSHNLRSIAFAMNYANKINIPKNAYEIQMLYGMAEPERLAMRSMGHRVRVYAPIGEMLPGMAYLVRRLLENTSNNGFLRMHHQENLDLEKLLQEPVMKKVNSNKIEEKNMFKNCHFTDFTDASAVTAMGEAIEKQKAAFPANVPVVINGKKQTTFTKITRHCPSQTELLVANIACATKEDANIAVENAFSAFEKWRNTTLEYRQELLLKLADILEEDRCALAALQTLEVAKPWESADADVAEAIDFCKYYALCAQTELKTTKQGSILGEENSLLYEGRGPTVVIAPWNFPLAILCGMSTAALVAGNPVVLKPAEQSSLVAYGFYECLMKAGFPKEVVQFLPGIGEDIGPTLVEHPKVAQIAFTGSKAVGHEIVKRAATVAPKQLQMKRVVCEMGGKNAILIDDDADLDEAILGVLESAFGFSGQKCSACSRVLVHKQVYEQFMSRLVEATKSIKFDKAHLPSCRIGPVVDADAYKKLNEIIFWAKANSKVHFLGTVPDSLQGYYVAPCIFEVDSSNHKLMQEEFFGPILAIMQVDSFEVGLKIACSTEFALTGAVYSRNPSNIDLAKLNFHNFKE